MRYSSTLIPTTREAPSDAQTVSHVLLARAGYIRRVGAGIYSFLPLGVRVLRNLETLIRNEMTRAGAQEVLLPALLPADLYRETGRWDSFGSALFRLKDRKSGDYLLGPTHEEVITDLARHELKSYRDLPKTLFQIQTKYRDEPRPRAGLLRCREFSMKDAYSFDVDEAAAAKSYDKMRAAYHRILSSLSLDYRVVRADSGSMGGSLSEEFQVLVDSGEDTLAACGRCDQAANLEVASAAAAPAPSAAKTASIERVHTPGAKSIDQVATFLAVTPRQLLKSLVFIADAKPILVVVRGDHEVNEIKLQRAVGAEDLRPAKADEVRQATHADVGFAGPIGFEGAVYIDAAAAAVHDAVAGANETDYHLKHLCFGRDFSAELCDVRSVVEGDPCPKCGAPLGIRRGIEAGHVFLLGTRYSDAMRATYLAEDGALHPLVMGCYGIGVSRLIATVVEQHHDADGICWPAAIAPYDVHVVQLGEDAAVADCVARVEAELEAAGMATLVDDRPLRPGAKFKDADLIGMPLRVAIGARGLAEGTVELKRRSETAKSAQNVPASELTQAVVKLVREAREPRARS